MSKKIEVNEETFVALAEDVREIKDWALGTKYTPGGVSKQIQDNTDCIQNLKKRQNKFFAIIGGAWTAFILGVSYLLKN